MLDKHDAWLCIDSDVRLEKPSFSQPRKKQSGMSGRYSIRRKVIGQISVAVHSSLARSRSCTGGALVQQVSVWPDWPSSAVGRLRSARKYRLRLSTPRRDQVSRQGISVVADAAESNCFSRQQIALPTIRCEKQQFRR